MILRYFYDERLAQASYLVGCAKTGEALVIDPARDVTPYLETAEQQELRVTHVAETHIHADFVSGGRELAAQTGAMLYVSDMGGDDWRYDFADENDVVALRDGDEWMVGNVRVRAIHTPGHTPEHLSYLLTDTAGADEPMGLFTGDTLFVGNVGRPDLLEVAVGVQGAKEQGAQEQFHNVQKLTNWADYLQVWPGHGAGSACGKALGAVPSSTLGYEKRFNPAFQIDDEGNFVDWLLADQPEAPRYFAQMKRVNKQGPALLSTLPQPTKLEPSQLGALVAQDDQVVDFRDGEAFAAAHVPGTLNIPASSTTFSTYVGWFVDYERPFYFVLPEAMRLDEMLVALRAIGVDNVGGYFTSDAVTAANVDTATLQETTAQKLAQSGLQNVQVIDVRGRSEFVEGHIEGAVNMPLGHLPRHLGDFDRSAPLVTQCASGYRSQIAASYLRAQGFEHVQALNDGVDKWSAILPTANGVSNGASKGVEAERK